MFAVCFEERILSSPFCCPQSWPWYQLVPGLANRDSGPACLSLAVSLSGHIVCLLSTHRRRVITQIGGTDPQVDILYIVRFSTWRKSICIKMIIPPEASLWPSVTCSRLEIVLFSLKKL